ncbi:hypothetical protein PR202_ga13337 [Eleusine coracana subsp. coracana]|uniref:Uncharacterized protein n=1 Tax=Eleusine coracana subsp. coracana TaxID=191504 RepID=A0AAV5CEJ6_ELECO|nr:hypothetical protein PR202_ga13337 [Eleusine coracana subsp. coracana]
MDDGKEAAVAQGQRGRAFPTGLLRVFLGFLLLGVGLSAGGMFLARRAVTAPTTGLFRPCLWSSSSATTAAAVEKEEEGKEPSDEGLERWTRPPPRARHSMTDEELLWRASFAPRGARGYPFRRVPKLVFMFLAHGPLPLAPLWERFFRGHEGRYSIYLHTMPAYQANFTAESVFYRRQIPSQYVNVDWNLGRRMGPDQYV